MNKTPHLKTKYYKEIIPKLQKKFGFTSPMQVPKILQVSINQGIAEAKTNPKTLQIAQEELTLITGQKAVPTKAKKSISNFKLRPGMKIGLRVTLRGKKMYEFLQRFIMIVLPQSKDFHGANPKSFDGRGNYNCGIREQIIFPEISIDKTDKIRGMNITFVTSTNSDKEALELLKSFGMPFKTLKK